jgi:hypothetical protein
MTRALLRCAPSPPRFAMPGAAMIAAETTAFRLLG